MPADLPGRIRSGFLPAVFALVIVVAGNPWFAAGAVLLGLVCLHELFQMTANLRPARLAGFLGLIALAVTADAAGREGVLLALVASVPVLFLLTIAGPSAEGGLLGMAAVLFGLVWIGLCIAHAVLLRDLPHGGGIVGAVLIGTFVGDSGAYFAGRYLVRRKLAARILLNKTVECLAAGIVTAVLTVWVVGLYQDWISGTEALLLGLGVALAAPLGDLFESFLKRSVGTKDTSRFFGAHGGALDRLDAILFGLVVGFYVWSAML